MTTKQQRILSKTIELCSQHSFHSISTKKIALESDVSEGLIFKHFTDKNGLLKAVITFIHERLNDCVQHILEIEDAKEILEKTIALPFHLSLLNIRYWSLLINLKHQNLISDDTAMVTSIAYKLQDAFNELKYRDATSESMLLFAALDHVIYCRSKDVLTDELNYELFLKKKYHLV